MAAVAYWLARSLVALAGIALSASSGWSMEAADAAYFCNAEVSGGIRFDEPSKKWAGAIFSPTDMFVVKLKYFEAPAVKSEEPSNSYDMSVTEVGSSNDARCLQLGSPRSTVAIGKFDVVSCYANSHHYLINFRSRRFLRVYTEGYTNGANTSGDTPSVTGGTCTKIN